MSTPTKPPAAGSEAAVEQEQVSGRERLGWLARNTKLWLGALILLILAIVIAAASGAIFTSSSANPENTFTAGNLSSSNSRPNVAILHAEDMVPSDTATGEVEIANTGDVSGRFRLSSSGITDTVGPNKGKLSEVLTLQIVDQANPGTPMYNGRFDAMPAKDLGSWPAGQKHRYTFTVTFPEGGTPSSATTGDNAFKDSATKIDFTWTATSE
jgi:archaellum component FlaG (FlaF/FlaG flagellin family)